MVELEWRGALQPGALRRAARIALRRFAPELRIVAEDYLMATSAADLLAVGVDGELVSIRIVDARDAARAERAFSRVLSDLMWLRPRVDDLAKLAPELGLEFGVEPRALLLAPEFPADLLLAAENLPAVSLGLMTYRALRHQGQLTLLLEPLKVEAIPVVRPAAEPAPVAAVEDVPSPSPLTGPPSTSVFRTGLTEADLRPEPRPDPMRAADAGRV